ncbi:MULTISPECIES: DUF5701 family protein [Streptomyces]|uniref:DUF5701 family protein n=1 Tax=Streptomyces TaxID=1883 RepID=UPI0004BE085A|nr:MULTISPECIES: DUF5701 family protein [Streptomyces]QHF97647.1 hypothetical protein DEH18_31600 [Streptomyces sp. NHF165]
MNVTEATREFDRQLNTLLTQGFPALSGRTEEEFSALVHPLRDVVEDVARHAPGLRETGDPGDETTGRAPFLLVVTRELAPVEETVPLLRLSGGRKPGVIDRHYEEGALEKFVPVEKTEPPAAAYLLLDADRGEEFCGAVPRDALTTLAERGRTPLTIEEGLAFVTHFPGALAKNRCFSLGASRCGDRRVPALWISERAPKLGWCWEGNPHSWLGMASAATRVAA